MGPKVYKSNIFAWWTSQRQDEALAKIVPGWPDADVREDELTARELRGNYWERLVERPTLFRPTTRSTPDIIYSASIAVWAKAEEDFRSELARLAVRGSTIVCFEGGTWTPDKRNIGKIVEAWKAARKQSRLEGAAKRGGQKTAEIKRAETAAKFAIIEERLKLPSSKENTTRKLLDEVGIKSVNTIKNHYGITREQMQARYQAAEKRKATKRRQKEGARA